MRKIANSIGGLAILLLSGCQSTPTLKIDRVVTTENKPWQIVLENKTQNSPTAHVILDTQHKGQTLSGIGGCFNEMGWDALKMLDRKEKEEVIRSLFDTEGCNFNLCRMPIGASDYATDWYSLNETPDDYEMAHFNIDRDKKGLIPYIKMAQQFQPQLRIWASPWSPPSWMKQNNCYACQSNKEYNDLSPENSGKEMTTLFKMEPKVLESYALYFSRFVTAYEKEGIPIEAVHAQNEFNSCQIFPSCVWNPQDLAIFIGDYLGPKMKQDHPNTQVWIGTIEREMKERTETILNYPSAKKYIYGAGFQWAGKGAIASIHKEYPNLHLMQTETECGNGSNDWAASLHTFDLMKHYFAKGAEAYMYWNMILTNGGVSRWGWRQNSMITLQKRAPKVIYHPEYYLMKHLSHFVKKGAHYIPSTSKEFDDCIAFENPNGDIVILACNREDTPKTIEFQWNNQTSSLDLTSKSYTTYVIHKN